MFEIAKLLWEVSRNLVCTLTLGLLALSSVSLIQSKSHPFDASQNYQKQFYANLGVFRPDLAKEIEGIPKRKLVMGLASKETEAKPEEPKGNQIVLGIKDSFLSIESQPSNRRLSLFIRFRDELVDIYRQADIPKHSYEYFMRQVQKRIYWEQKFQSVQQLSLGESFTEVAEVEGFSEQPTKLKKKKSSKKVM